MVHMEGALLSQPSIFSPGLDKTLRIIPYCTFTPLFLLRNDKVLIQKLEPSFAATTNERENGYDEHDHRRA